MYQPAEVQIHEVFGLTADVYNALPQLQQQQLTLFYEQLNQVVKSTDKDDVDTIAILANAIRTLPQPKLQTLFPQGTAGLGNMAIICRAFGQPLCATFMRHSCASPDQYATFFFAFTRFVDEGFMTPLSRLNRFAPDVFNAITRGIAHPEFPVSADITIAVVTLACAVPNLIVEIKNQQDARDLLDWQEVNRKMGEAAQHWFSELQGATATVTATAAEAAPPPDAPITVDGKTAAQQKAEQQEQEQRARAHAIVSLLLEYLRLDAANAELFGDKYAVVMDQSTQSLRLQVKPEALDGRNRLNQHNAQPDAPAAPPIITTASEKPQWISTLEQSKLWNIFLILCKGFMIYGMLYWLLTYFVSLAPTLNTWLSNIPWLPATVFFSIPLLCTIPYFIFHIYQAIRPPNTHQSEEDRALRIALDYAHLKEHLAAVKEQFFVGAAASADATYSSRSSNTRLQTQTENSIQSLQALDSTSDRFFQNLLLNDKQASSQILNRKEQVRKFFEKIKGNHALTSELTRGRRGLAGGAVFGLTFGLIFAWVILDAFSTGTKIRLFGVENMLSAPTGFNPYQLLVDPSNLQSMPIVMPIVIALIAIVILVTLYNAFTRYWDNKEKFQDNQKKLNNFVNAQPNDSPINSIDTLAEEFVTLAEEAARKKFFLKHLQATLKQIKENENQKNLHNWSAVQVTQLDDLIAKSTLADLPQFDGRYSIFLGFTLHSDSYFRRQEDKTDSKWDRFKIAGSKTWRRVAGFIEGAGTGSLIVGILIGSVLTALLPNIIPMDLLGHPLNYPTAFAIIAGIMAVAGITVAVIKFIRDHAGSQEKRQEKFIDELPLRQQYLLEENKFLDAQIAYVNSGIAQLAGMPVQVATTAPAIVVGTAPIVIPGFGPSPTGLDYHTQGQHGGQPTGGAGADNEELSLEDYEHNQPH